MSIYTRVFNIMIAVLLFSTLTSCGNNNSKSDKAKISIIPGKPIVITADTKIGDKEIPAPWFNFRASMSNNSDTTVTIIALELEITGVGKTGTTTTGKAGFVATDFNETIQYLAPGATAPVNVECKYRYFAQLDPSTSSELKLMGAASVCGTPTPVFYIGNNPTGPDNAPNYRYTVKIKPLGWFGTYDLPTDRFEKTQTFYTQ